MITFSLHTALRRLRHFGALFTGTTRVHGVRLSIDKRHLPPPLRRWILGGDYESGECTLVRKYIRPGDRVLEIGAGTGLVGILASRLSGRTVATCEANPDVLPLLRENYRLNGLQPQIVAPAVTADGRDVTLYLDRRIVGSSVFDRCKEDGNFQPVQVKSRPLDALLSAHGPDVLLMDAEGAEAELLPAADLSNLRMIIYEQHPWLLGDAALADLQNLLTGQGFALIEKQDDVLCFGRSA